MRAQNSGLAPDLPNSVISIHSAGTWWRFLVCLTCCELQMEGMLQHCDTLCYLSLFSSMKDIFCKQFSCRISYVKSRPSTKTH